MNEIKKCSISGIQFSFDPEAYDLLKQYLETLKTTYKDTEGGEEIVADIEARIAELILSTQDNERVVASPLIRNIIAQLGSPEDISEEDPQPHQGHTSSPEQHFPRRLYRELKGAKLGGVCTGLGHYFDIDPVWIRLGIFLPLILNIWIDAQVFSSFILLYLLLWFTVPAARSARQRLEMEGQPITARSVAEQAAENGSDADSSAKPIVAQTVSLLGRIVLLGLKILAGLIVTGLILLFCAMLTTIFAVLINDVSIPGLQFADIPTTLIVLAILTVTLPCALLLYTLIRLIMSRKPTRPVVLTLILLWLVNILALGIGSAKYLSKWQPPHSITIEGDSPEESLTIEELQSQLDDLNGVSSPDKSLKMTIRDGEQHTTINVSSKKSANGKSAALEVKANRDTLPRN